MKDKESELNSELINLNDTSQVLYQMGKPMLETNGLFLFDLYCSGILNRTLNLTKGFIDQIQSQNFLSAAPLVRLNLDTLLRLYGAFRFEPNIDLFAKQVMEGKAINKIKDRTGNLMKDTYLVGLLTKENGFNWVEKIYNTGNQYVHLTHQHIFATIKLEELKERKIEGLIAWGDSFIPEFEKIWATRAMIQINLGIQKQLQKWIDHKQSLVDIDLQLGSMQ